VVHGPSPNGTPVAVDRGGSSTRVRESSIGGPVSPKVAKATVQDAALQAAQLSRGAVDCLPAGALERKCANAIERGRPLRIKLGIDPTAPDVHLGHAVVLRKLREFQDAGHLVVLIVGDFTAQVGDPSGRSQLRPVLSAEQIERNAATYRQQALRILRGEPDSLEVRRNGEWLEMGSKELLALLQSATVAQLLERDDFAQRMAAGRPISILEMLYPLLQGYDSVAVHADVELGGTDQTFNLLIGRDVQRAYGQEEQAIVTMPILVGTDGERKMSKSLGNQIALTDDPQEIYGKTMSLPDHAMGSYFRLLLGREPPAELSPRDAKRTLARGLVSWLYSPAAAEQAELSFDRVFLAKELPHEMPELVLDGAEPSVHLPAVIANAFGVSRSEARRLLAEGAVSLAGRRVEPNEMDVSLDTLDGQVLQVGKRRFVRLRAG
jgi:tyrosyl-tRNA synthetase